MGGNHDRRGLGASRREPPWPAVLATTARLWFERHAVRRRHAARRAAGRPVMRRAAVLLACVLAAAALGAGLTAALTRQPPAPAADTTATSPLQAAAQVRGQAAAWIAQQVSPAAVVACDPAMCSALQASGLPAARLLVLGTAAPDPLGSDVVVATAAVRSQFGARLAAVYAPLIIASFGSGAGRIDVRALAPDGAAAVTSALAADRRARAAAGEQLLRNSRVSASAPARAALLAGRVDPRLLVTLSALAAEAPLRLVAFGDSSPGASPAVPLRGAEIGAAAPAGLSAMLAFLAAQRPPYRPAMARIARGAGGQPVLTVRFDAPGPLGLGGPSG